MSEHLQNVGPDAESGNGKTDEANRELVAARRGRDEKADAGGSAENAAPKELRGFGSGALKVKGRIFAMISSKGYLVLKLPKERVDSLVAAGEGENFDPGHGRIMKEWVVVTSDAALWVELAREARQFADGARKKKI